MAKPLTPEQQKEYERLFAQWRQSVNRAYEALVRYGMESKAFANADAKTTEIWRKMRAMQGLKGKHWMA